MWMIRRKSAEELDSILYFLSDALTSVIDDNSYLAHHRAAVPQIGAGLATAEIASRLAMFREQVRDVSQREHMVLTRLERARHWARELRRYEPHLRADIDAFLSVTARCETMARRNAPDPQGLFDGEAQPKRFLAGRVPGGRIAAEAAMSLMERLSAAEAGELADSGDAAPRYMIGGELSVDALNEACERLLARLSVHYGWEDEAGALDDETGRDDLIDTADKAEAAESEPEAEVAGPSEDSAVNSADGVSERTAEAEEAGDAGTAEGTASSEADASDTEGDDDPFARDRKGTSGGEAGAETSDVAHRAETTTG